MDIEKLRERLLKAYRSKSLRELGRLTNVSHETLRKIVGSPSINLTANNYKAIDEGLKANGF